MHVEYVFKALQMNYSIITHNNGDKTASFQIQVLLSFLTANDPR